MKPRLFCLCVLAILAAAAARGGEAKFTTKPRAARQGAGARISFAVSAPTDVEVAVLDSKGKVIRHLAAGLLGDKASAPFKRGLSQEIVWDGKADWGRPAAGGPFKVRVAIGMKPTFQKIIGHNPAALGGISAIATNPKNGELYVFHLAGAIHPNDSSTTCSVFSRDGKYLRTILPWPANTPVEKLKGLKRVKLADGSTVPFFYQAETRSLVPGAGELVLNGPAVTGDGRIVFAAHQEMCSTATRYNQPGRKVVTVINTDGSMPASGIFKAVLAQRSQAAIMLALSPDEKTLYAAGVGEGYGGKKLKSKHAVHKFGWTDKAAKVFVGNPATAGSGATGLNTPVDVATDKDGNVYVADRGNNRIAVFKPDGGHLGDIKVEEPKRVKVNPETGAVYVLSGTDKTNQLTKFASWKGGAPAATATLPRFRYPRSMCMALDSSAAPPLIWIASPGSGSYAVPRFTLLRIEDRGAAFGDQKDVAKLKENSATSVGSVMMVSYDRRQDRLLVNGRVYDPASGKLSSGVRMDGKKRGMGSVGLDGKLYLMYYPRNLSRFGPDLKQIPFPGGKKGQVIGPAGTGSLRLRTRGVTADPAGDIYALWQFKDPAGASHGNTNHVTLHGPDGKVKKLKFIDSDTRAIHSPRLDCQGNFYLALGARPKGQDYPKEIAGQDLGKPWKSRGFNTNDINWYHLMYGSIVKFGPEGGTVRKGSGGTPMAFSYGKETEVKGAKWIYYGASPVPSWRMKYPDTCLCESSRFDVDGYGRVFFPDTARFKVGVLDPAGKLICRFGDYGNQDSAGPKSRIPEPEIPVLWVDQIAVGGGVVYLGDRLNKRVVAVKLNHAAEETCPVQ